MVDDALHKDGVGVDVAGNRGHEFRNEVIDGRGGEADAIALGIGAEARLQAGHIEIRDADVEDGRDDLRVVEGVAAVIVALPDNLVDTMPECDAEY